MTQNNSVTLKIGADAGMAIAVFSSLGNMMDRTVMGILRTVKRVAMALPNAVQQALNTADTMVKRSQVAGMSTEEFSALMHVAKLSGVQMGELEMAARHAARMHNTTLGPALLATARDMEGMTDEAAKLAMAQHRFGRSGTVLLPILNQGSDAIREQLLEARKFGTEISSGFGKKAEFFNDTLERIKTAFQGMTLRLAEGLIPKLQEFADRLLKFATNEQLPAGIDRIAKAAIGLAESLERVASARNLEAFGDIFATSFAVADYAVQLATYKTKSRDGFTPITEEMNRFGRAFDNTLGKLYNETVWREMGKEAGGAVGEAFNEETGNSKPGSSSTSVQPVKWKPMAGSKVVIEVPKEQAQSAFTTRGFLSAGEASLANRQLAWQNVVAGLLGSIDNTAKRYLPKLEEQEI